MLESLDDSKWENQLSESDCFLYEVSIASSQKDKITFLSS